MNAIGGDTAAGWEVVADAFRANFARGCELGAACSVYFAGEKVVDLWGGTADSRSDCPWREDTVVLVFSTTKGATAICAHLLAQKGELDLDAPVVSYWPEYGAEGKERTLVRWLLSHQAGVPAVDGVLTLEEICSWEPVIRALEAQKPFWVPGEQHMYHALTYGFLVGEVVRRASGRSLGRFFEEEIARPLDLDAWIGTPADVEPRVAHLVSDPPPKHVDLEAGLKDLRALRGLSEEAVDALVLAMKAVDDPQSLEARSMNLGGAFAEGLVTESGGYNARSIRAAELPGVNMVTDARSLARMYAAAVGDVDGVRLLQPETVAAACAAQWADNPAFGQSPARREFDEAVGGGMSLGFMLPNRLNPLLGPRSFGHGGAGGSMGFADPDAVLGFGYVMNRMSEFDDSRARELIEAVSGCANG